MMWQPLKPVRRRALQGRWRTAARGLAAAALLGLLATLPQAAAAQSAQTTKADIAVWDFTLAGVNDAEGQAIANRLRSELVGSGLFRVMSRNQLRTLLGEIELGQTLGDPQAAIQAGKLKGVRYVVAGSVVAVGSAVQVTAELIDGETAEILMSVTPRPFKGDLVDYLDIEVPYLAQRLAGVEQQRAEQQRSAGYEAARSGDRWRFYTGLGIGLGGIAMLAQAHATAAVAEEQAAEAQDTLSYPKYQESRDTYERAKQYELIGFVGILVGTVMLADYYGIGTRTSSRQAERATPAPTLLASVTPSGAAVGWRWQF